MVIDDVFQLLFGIILDFVPNLVWKILLLLVGIATTAVGATMIGESPQIGGGLILVGMVLLVGSLVSLVRD
jgi:hypothetical protein